MAKPACRLKHQIPRKPERITHFAFFENYMSEKTKSHVNEYKYDDIQKVLETGKYFFIFHNSESVSIVDKAHFSGDVESFSGFIKTKTQYKKIK